MRRCCLVGVRSGRGPEPDADADTDDPSEGSDDRAEDESDDGRATSRGRTTTTTESLDRVLTGAEAAGPVVGEETGLTVIVETGPGLALVDLDTGAVTTIDGVDGAPVALLGTSVVLERDGWVDLVDLSVEDPTIRSLADRNEDTRDGSDFVEVVEVADGLVWVASGDGSGVLRGYDEAGRLENRLDVGDGFVVRWSAKGLVWNLVGGVYRFDGDGYERLSSGILRAVGDDLVVVEECDDAMRCGPRWYDLDTWSEVDLPAPPRITTFPFSHLVGGDRWLVDIDWDTDSTGLIEVATGDRVRDLSPLSGGQNRSPVAISDDGRWLVDPTPGGRGPAVIVDLDSGAEWAFPAEVQRVAGALLVDSARVAPPGR